MKRSLSFESWRRPALVAAGTSLLFVVLVLGQAAGAPVLGGLVAGPGFGTAFVVAAVLMLAGGLVPLRERSRGGSRLAAGVSPSS